MTGQSVVLDSNVLSELMRSSPAPVVVSWVHDQRATSLCTTAVSVAEVRYGIARLPAGRRRTALRRAADEVFDAFVDRVLAFDADAARHHADVVAERDRRGEPISGFDAQIAAVCRGHGAVLATRDVAGFTGLGLDLVDPWAGPTRV